jgi:hypothetical protein
MGLYGLVQDSFTFYLTYEMSQAATDLDGYFGTT